jgi:ribonuclease-3
MSVDPEAAEAEAGGGEAAGVEAAGPDALRALLEQLPGEMAEVAFTHASWAPGRPASYERLAFLGDSVLGLAVSEHLFPRFESYGAGELTKVRAQAVARHACAEVARELELPARLESAAPDAGGPAAAALVESDRVLASVCEAVIGAVFLAFGYARVAPAVVAAFADQIERALRAPVDFKSDLQERLARSGEAVLYRIDLEEGPPHDRRFVAVALAGEQEVGRGEGRTKKGAEQEAARRALDRLGATRMADAETPAANSLT